MAKRSLMKLLLCLALVIATVGLAAANGPELMVYSGSIPQGVNQGDGPYEISFSIYSSEQGGSALWTETQNVYVYQGTFAVYLGAVQRLNLAFDVPYWVGVKTGDKEDIWTLTGAGYPLAVGGGEAASTGTRATSLGTGATSLAVAADTVLSASLKEADGTTGQNTNTGSGIKTNHIQNAAVTGAKIAAGAVTGAKIAAGAVTDAKITGPISASKISATGLNADKLDGLDSTAFLKTTGGFMTGAIVTVIDTADDLSAYFYINNSANSSPALYAGTRGTGYAGEFDGGVKVNGKLTATSVKLSGAASGIVFDNASKQSKAATDCLGRYEDNGDGTVSDCRTGLIWLKDANCFGGKPWPDAMTAVAALGNGACGLTDRSQAGFWRLPTISEWMAMIASAKKQGFERPILTNSAGSGHWTAGDAFLNIQSWGYWASTSHSGDPSFAWSIDTWSGGVFAVGKGDWRYFGYFVWPVRAGQ